MIFAFATGACAHLPLTTADLGPHPRVAALCAAFAWTVNVAGAAVIGLTPQRRAAATALNATATALAARTDLTARPGRVWPSTPRGTASRSSASGTGTTAEHRDLVRAVHACELLLTPARPRSPPPSCGPPRSPRRRANRCPNCTGGRRCARPAARLPLAVIRDVLARRPPAPPRRVLAAAARPPRVHRRAARRDDRRPARLRARLLGGGVRGVGAAATSTATSVPRMLQRVTGTVFGVLVGAAVLGAQPTLWVLLVVLVLLQWGAEMTVTINYGLVAAVREPGRAAGQRARHPRPTRARWPRTGSGRRCSAPRSPSPPPGRCPTAPGCPGFCTPRWRGCGRSAPPNPCTRRRCAAPSSSCTRPTSRRRARSGPPCCPRKRCSPPRARGLRPLDARRA
ncbi:FUSC family protein [Saccharopolyspora gregorii]|uniref:FUSC family protein n=1 Tax=Saccharopolyspora gregorii TaxID=33914 RepID=UPI0031EF6645